MPALKVDPEDWPRISARLDEALALAPQDQPRWLDTIDEPDRIKTTLRRLLADATGVETGDFLGELPRMTLGAGPAPGADTAHAPRAGSEVGPYRLLSELGRGGMGMVWLAERTDGQPKRKVALKLPHLGWAPGLIQRLGRERDILASLEHPNIARLYDAGSDALGRPYLALEYVDGTPIDRYCEDERLPLRDRLRLLLRVASAVAFAHTRLVVHRDLKPSNILVTKEGDVRLLDFGIARLLADDGAGELTRAGAEALTPEYASPEQIRGSAIGTQSDLYSLGVVAYELLAGRRPYVLEGRRSIAALAEAIATADVPAASRAAADPALKKSLAGDLDAILNKALKKDPAERYATVDAFVDDLERHLRDAPVAARADTLAYRARKFVARNTLQVSAAALVAVAVLAGAGVALWQARVAKLEAERAEQVKRFALSIVNGADTEAGAGKATTAAELLQAAKARIDSELADNPQTAVELMTAVGTGLQSQGLAAEAAEVLQAALERATRALGPGHRLTLAAATAYGQALLGTDRPKESIALLAETARQAGVQGNALARAAALRELSSAQLAAAEGQAGLASARAAVDAFATARNATQLDAFYAWAQLANAMNATQDPGLADAARHALGLAREVYGDRLTDNVLSARLLLASGLTAQGRHAEGLDELEAVYRDAVRLLGPQHPRIEAVANFLGRARGDAGDAAGAVAALRVALSLAERNASGTGGNRGIGHYVLGRALAQQHRYDEALEHFRTGASLLQASIGGNAIITARARAAAAGALARLGRLDEADAAFGELNATPLPPAERALRDDLLAILRSRQGRHDEAITLARAAADTLKAGPAATRAGAAATLGEVLLAAGQRDASAVALREAIGLWSGRERVPSPDRVDAEARLAVAIAPPPASTSAAAGG